MILDVPYSSQYKDTKKEDWKDKACGVTALKMVLDYYQQTNLSVDEFFQKGLDLNGYLQDVGWYHHSLVNIAQTLGYKGITRSWNIPNASLTKLVERGFKESDIKVMEDQLLEEGIFTLKKALKDNTPVIVSVPRNFKKDGSGHLVVVTGFDKNGFIINDPDDLEKSGQKKSISFQDFKEVWTKRAIIIRK